jgi:hypothetical protein
MAGKGGKGKLIGIIVGVLLLGGGAVVGLAIMGMINIPGLTPKKKKGPGMYGEAALAMYAEKKDAAPKPAAVAKKEEEPLPEPEPPKVDEQKGAEALAEIYNSMPNDKIVAIMKDWKDLDVARVLMVMETEKSAALLGLMEPTRASKVSDEIKRLGGTPAAS